MTPNVTPLPATGSERAHAGIFTGRVSRAPQTRGQPAFRTAPCPHHEQSDTAPHLLVPTRPTDRALIVLLPSMSSVRRPSPTFRVTHIFPLIPPRGVVTAPYSAASGVVGPTTRLSGCTLTVRPRGPATGSTLTPISQNYGYGARETEPGHRSIRHPILDRESRLVSPDSLVMGDGRCPSGPFQSFRVLARTIARMPAFTGSGRVGQACTTAASLGSSGVPSVQHPVQQRSPTSVNTLVSQDLSFPAIGLRNRRLAVRILPGAVPSRAGMPANRPAKSCAADSRWLIRGRWTEM